ncbi:DUF3060 domain-containing protein [Actinomyces dentalis]|uniref:DUF3060 domain-containing protein n=1 Tax=Actinomyces dentalis TaxID=272548 RepID=UPI0028F12C1B|nr:DUF3060 domain-containing protein [Actinomyces dentalis]
MRLSKIVLAGAATVALSLSLGACSLSVNDAGSASPKASQAQGSDAGSTGAQGSTGTGSTGSTGSTAGGATGSTGSNNPTGSPTGSGDHDGDDDDDAEDAPITNAAWKEILDKGERQTVSGSYAVQGSGTTLNLVGDLDMLTVQGAENTIAAEDVDTLIIQGSDVTVYARDIDHLQIQGSNVTVHWLGDDPDIQDLGANNTTGRLTQ